jgi:hypothetical protein
MLKIKPKREVTFSREALMSGDDVEAIRKIFDEERMKS